MKNTGGKVNDNHLIHQLMHINQQSLLIAMLSFALIILPALAGCDWVQDREIFYGTEETTEQTQQTTTQTQGPTPVTDGGEVETQTRADVKNVRYELAEGWHWDNPTDTIAIKGPEYKIAEQFDGKMEFGGVWEGGDEAAKTHAKATYEAYKQGCLNTGEYCEKIPEYGELNASGTPVYCAYDINAVNGDWISYCEFAKNGKTVRYMLYNRAEKEMPLLEKMVSTILWD